MSEQENPFETADAWEPYLDRFISEEGNYVFEIKEASDSTSQQGNPQIFLQLEAKEGLIKDWVTYNRERVDKAKAVFLAAGVRMPKLEEIDFTDNCRVSSSCIDLLVGRKVGGVVRKEDSYKDPTKQVLRVQGYVQPQRLTADAPIDTRGLEDTVGVAADPDGDYPF